MLCLYECHQRCLAWMKSLQLRPCSDRMALQDLRRLLRRRGQLISKTGEGCRAFAPALEWMDKVGLAGSVFETPALLILEGGVDLTTSTVDFIAWPILRGCTGTHDAGGDVRATNARDFGKMRNLRLPPL